MHELRKDFSVLVLFDHFLVEGGAGQAGDSVVTQMEQQILGNFRDLEVSADQSIALYRAIVTFRKRKKMMFRAEEKLTGVDLVPMEYFLGMKFRGDDF